MKYADIIERLEKTEGPDRWLDARIDAALRIGTEKMRGTGYEWAWSNFPVWHHHTQSAGMCGVMHDNGDLGLIWDSEQLTASVDASLALVDRLLPDHAPSIQKPPKSTLGALGVSGPVWGSSMIPDEMSVDEAQLMLESGRGVETAPTAPLAILLALFKALEAKERRRHE